MSENTKCPECFHTERFNGKYCSECGYSLNNTGREASIWQKLIRFVGRQVSPILIGTGVVLVIWTFFLPAPYSLRYLFKRVFFEPTSVCRDGVYSFSSSRSGSCSGHGGVSRWLK